MDGECSEDARFELLVHCEEIRNSIRQMVGCPHLAEDLAQETFCRAFSAIARKNKVRNTAAWLHAIARNVVRDHVQKTRRHPSAVPCEVDLIVDGQQTDLIAEEVPSDSDYAALATALDSLRPVARTIVVAYYFQGKNCATIGAELGLDRRTVNYRLYHARRRLRQRLRMPRGGVP